MFKEMFTNPMNEVLITLGKKAYPKFGNIVILAGGAGCFDGDTVINTSEGYKNISDIKINDKVLSINEDTKVQEYQKVTNTFIYKPEKKMIEIIFEDENGEESKVKCTSDHKFLVGDKWVEAKDLEYVIV